MNIVDEVKKIASEVNKTAAQVALAWTLSKSVTSVLLGASKIKQLEDNLGSIDVKLSADQVRRLDDVSQIALGFPHETLANPVNKEMITGGFEIYRK